MTVTLKGGLSVAGKPAALIAEQQSSLFSDVVTLDPSEVLGVWDRLSVDTTSLQVASLPHILHRVLIRTLQERFGNGRSRTNQ